MKFINKNILLISSEPWGENFISKHHYALELSKSNKVYFLNPPSANFSINQVNKNLIIVDYKHIFRGINRLPSYLRDTINAMSIQRIIKLIQVFSFDIIWTFDPFRFQNLSLFKSPFLIYHPVDIHNTPLEKEITCSAHLILTTCDFIKKKLESYNSNIYNIGHGVSEYFLNKPSRVYKRSDKVKACMMGNLQRKIDYPSLFSLIKKHPEVEFHFIGPLKSSNLSKSIMHSFEIEKLNSFANTYLHGSVPQDQLPAWLNQMDIFLILYRDDENPASRANPHKVLEFLSTGKIILSYYMEEYSNHDELLVMVKEKDKLQSKFREIIDKIEFFNDKDKMGIRIEFVKKHTYANKLFEITTLCNSHVSENK